MSNSSSRTSAPVPEATDGPATTCVACGGTTTTLRLPLERAALALCPTCGHAVTIDTPRSVGAAEYAADADALAVYERWYLPARLASYDSGLELLGPGAGRRILDVGCNYGHFLARAQDAGWDVWGAEAGELLKPHSVPSVRDRIVRELHDAASHGPFDAITLWDVLEHVEDPEQLLSELAPLLGPDGRLLVRVPDAEVFSRLHLRGLRGPVSHLYLKLGHPVNPEEHPSHFTTSSLERIARRAGLEPVSTIASGHAERVAAGHNAVDRFLRRRMHRVATGLPYEFTTVFRAATTGSAG